MSILPRTSGIYRITCTANNKIYIGSSVDIAIRWYRHCRYLRLQGHHNRHLQNAYNKHGQDAFVIDVLEICEPDVLKVRENYYLDTLKPFSPNGFNIAYDATRPQLGHVVTAETRAKLSAIHKGKTISDAQKVRLSEVLKGREISAETIAKRRVSLKGHIVSPETRAKISAANTGKPLSPERLEQLRTANIGRVPSPETRTKISLSHMGLAKGRKASPETREKLSIAHGKSYIVTAPDGVETVIHGLTRFCREHGLDAATMTNVANGVYKHHKHWLCRHA